MSTQAPYYVFSGHAVGLAAQFHRLDDLENLPHVVPTQAAAVLPATGGLSEGHSSHYCFSVEQPRRRSLVSLQRASAHAHGRTFDDRWETEVHAEVEAAHFVEKLEIGLVRLHMVSTRSRKSSDVTVSIKGSVIEGLQMGGMTATVVLNEEPVDFVECAATNRRTRVSLVREIRLDGTQDPNHEVRLEGDYTIKWDGFGRIIVGEMFVKGNDRRITMLRLHMGSDAGGSGSVGDGSSNGQPVNN